MPNEIEIEPPRRQQLVAGAPVRPIIPTTIEEAFRLAQWICGARLAPDSYGYDEDHMIDAQPGCAHKMRDGRCIECKGRFVKKEDPDPQKVVIGILKSIEVGLPPITGLSTIAIVRKRPCIWGDGAIALVQRTGLVDRIEQRFEGDETANKDPALTDFPDSFRAVFRIWRKGQPEPYEGNFSVREARRAHLWGNTKKIPWIEYPRRMLMARARAYALREGFADALAGLSIREEIEDLPPEPPPRTDVSFLDDAPRSLPAPSEAPLNAVVPNGGEKERASVMPEPETAVHMPPDRHEGEPSRRPVQGDLLGADRTEIPILSFRAGMSKDEKVFAFDYWFENSDEAFIRDMLNANAKLLAAEPADVCEAITAAAEKRITAPREQRR